MKIANGLVQAALSLIACFAALSAHAADVDHSVDHSTASLNAWREGDDFVAEMHVDSGWNGDVVQAQIGTNSFQFDFRDAGFVNEKRILSFKDSNYDAASIAMVGSGIVRVRLVLNPGFSAQSLAEQIHFAKSADSVTIYIHGDPKKMSKNAKVETMQRSYAVLEASEPTADLAQAKLVAGAPAAPAPVAATTNAPTMAAANVPATIAATGSASEASLALKEATPAKANLAKLSESDIPVVATTKEVKKADGGAFQKLMLTLGVLALSLGALVFGLRRWASKNGSRTQNTKIKVLTQHHLGPKKSLAIIQVAGESILVGITDHNISMIKSLSLIDDEIPENVPKDFSKTLSGFDSETEDEIVKPKVKVRAQDRFADEAKDEHRDDFAMSGLAEVRDVVSTRLKNMRRF